MRVKAVALRGRRGDNIRDLQTRADPADESERGDGGLEAPAEDRPRT